MSDSKINRSNGKIERIAGALNHIGPYSAEF